MVKEIKIIGKVLSGKGGGRSFLKLPWVKQQITAKLLFTPYLGTLNIQISSDSTGKRKLLEKVASMMVYPAEGYSTGKIFKATIDTVKCGIVIPEVVGYPQNLIEIIAPVNLREKLQLSDGDEIIVTVIL